MDFLRHRVYFFMLPILLLLLVGCSTTRNLKENEILLRDHHIKLKTDKTFSDKGALSDQLYALTAQRPNSYFLGKLPFKLWLYNLRYKKYQADTSNFQIETKVVEKPVILDSALVERSQSAMIDFLNNQGYFYASVHNEIKIKNKKAKVTYHVNTGVEYLINEVSYEVANEGIKSIIEDVSKETLLERNVAYSHTLAGAERSRLTNAIRNYGYYRFTAENIHFELDTLDKSYFRNLENPFESAINFITLQRIKKKPTLDIKVTISLGEDSLAFNKYRFAKVVVFPDYKDTADLRSTNMLTKRDDGLEFKYHDRYVNTTILQKKIYIRPGKLYSQDEYDRTIRQLNDLGIFQYVRLRYFNNREDSTNSTLNCYIMLSPSKKHDFNTNVEVSGGDLYAIGTAANLSVTDKNFLKGANQLTTTVSYGLEMGRNPQNPVPYFKQFYLFSQNFGLNFRLTFPKFILPVSQRKFSQRSLPKTVFNAGFNSLVRPNYFTLQSINASFGYNWRESNTKTWTVRPAFINTLHLSNISDTFRQRMDSIPAIRNSYQETFIEGEGIEFLVNTEGRNKNRHAYLRLGLEEAGLLMSGVSALTNAVGGNLGFNYAHYVRLDFDMRQYFQQRNASVAFRFYGGIGLPYGGSTTLPYLKQYFVGGAYSIRGWRPRVLGPGSYYDAGRQESRDNLFIDQAGDIKLELNGEYRFAIIRLFSNAISLNGALFTDAGNIWLNKEDKQMPGAEFKFNRLYQDIAMSTGAGLRVDLGGFLVVRLDWAFPIKKPYINENNGWVIKDIKFGDPEWRNKNLNFSAAIGYPF
jgi:outer membrane protein insertion porin family